MPNTPRAYYNDTDPYCAEWLYNLQRAKLIAPGDIDTRPIQDVRPSDLKPYTQCHFFAGLGGWSYALRLANIPDDFPVWTGSCPCQPFSAAGKGGGFADERHLWPHFHYLIEQCRPLLVLGEQVASKDGLAWFDLVQSDLEGSGYAAGAVDSCSAGFGAPHIRQRLYWMAYTKHGGWRKERSDTRGCAVGDSAEGRAAGYVPSGAIGELAEPDSTGREPREWNDPTTRHGNSVTTKSFADRYGLPRPTNGFWRNADWLLCRDGKWRPVEPGTFPLVNGASARVGRLRAYGNAINVIQAQAFIEAAMSVLGGAKEQP